MVSEDIINLSVTPDGREGIAEGSPFAGYSLEDLRLTQDFAGETGVKQLITTVPVKRPDRDRFFRVNSDPAFKLPVAVIEFKEVGEIFIVHPALAAQLAGETKPKQLVVCVSRQGVLSIWPLALPEPDGRINPWHRSGMEAAQLAENHWIRLVPNTALGAYEIYQAQGSLGEPAWPELTMQQIVDIAFKDKIIAEPDHPVLRQLRGEV